jgi:hypothetical protein
VNDRYARYFEHVRVDTFHMPSPGQQQFLIDGVIGKLVPAT